MFQLLQRQARRIRVDILTPMRLHNIPLSNYLVEILPLENHRLKYLFIERNYLLYLYGQIILIRKGIGQHYAGSYAHRRNHKVVDDEVVDICLPADVEQKQMFLVDVANDFLGLPRVQLIHKFIIFLVAG